MDIYKIGKNVIENLTTGMYSDSKIIFREYIQNSADSIDKAKSSGLLEDEAFQIAIEIDDVRRTIRIKDNALGIKFEEAKEKLSRIADSDKDRDEDKGFRGIGRLGGLAYCDTLRFKTTYFGEAVETVMVWNAKLCRELINDKKIRDSAEEILRKVISFEEKPCDECSHYFVVEMNDIKKENTELLEIDAVTEYVSSNAPVTYNNKFFFNTEIYDYVRDNGFTLDEYCIHINGKDVYKNYGTHLYVSINDPNKKSKYDEIYEIEFKQFKNKDDELLAWMWFGISAFEKQIPIINNMRGLRIRKSNIQIGNSETLIPFFPEPRGNLYFIGEIHVVHKDLIPNARRDYFNETATRNELEAELKYYFKDTLHRLYHHANKVKNLYKREKEYLQIKSDYVKKQQQGFISNEEVDTITKQVETAKSTRDSAKLELERIKEKAANNPTFERVISVISNNHTENISKLDLDKSIELPIEDANKNKKKKQSFRSNKLRRLNDKQQKLVSKIYNVIIKNLPNDLSESLIKKIEDELNNETGVTD